MKILNIFKKQNKNKVVTTHKLDKKQLEKVIGGTDATENKAINFGTGLASMGSGK